MPRSHPPTVLTLVRRSLKEEIALAPGTRLLLGVSGGVDSMVLLHALSRLAPEFGLELLAHGVDHGLRSEAGAELDLAERFASEELGIAFSRTRVVVAAGGNLQARARAARYSALREAAKRRGAAFIATAHHADDRAETVLMRLLRGTTPRGLGVLPPVNGDLVRPLLRARRADISAHAARHRLPFAEDPSNRDRRFLRSRVRYELLPLLEELSPGAVGHLNALADELLAGAPGALAAPDGTPIQLGRAQRKELSRMLKKPSGSAELRLSGGRKVRVEPRTGKIVVSG